MAIDLQAAIAVFDKSADRTRHNAQTEAWAVIRAELMRVMDAPVGIGMVECPWCTKVVPTPVTWVSDNTATGRLVPADGGG